MRLTVLLRAAAVAIGARLPDDRPDYLPIIGYGLCTKVSRHPRDSGDVAALPLALSKSNVADYVVGLFAVYTILILLNILISFVPRMPYHPWLRVVLDFITETTDPYLNIFRSIMRPLGGPGGMAIDLSPMLAILVLGIVGGIITGAFF